MISIVYNPTSIDDFQSAVKFLQEHGITSAPAPVVSRPVTKEDGPYVSRYKAETKSARFRLSEDERQLMADKNLTVEDIAKIRLEGVESVLDAPAPVERPEGLGIFTDDDE